MMNTNKYKTKVSAPDNAHELAKEFSRVLRSWLNPTEMELVIGLNKDESDPRICHSHDFCDANMAMDEAFTKVIGHDVDADNGSDAVTWSKAWDIAVKSEFKVEGGDK